MATTWTTTIFIHRERHRREALLVQLPQRATVRHQRLHQPLPVQLPTGLHAVRTTLDKSRLLPHGSTHHRTAT
eukprot:941115-Amphidinium_carterae.1